MFDLVLMVDVIEHMPKPDGQALLERIPGWVVIATPDGFMPSDVDADEWPTEVHRSGWTVADFEATGRVDVAWSDGTSVYARLLPTE